MLRYYLWFPFSVLDFWRTLKRPLSWVFFLSQNIINWRRQYLNLCLCWSFCFTFALNLPEINSLLIGNSGYSRLICNDAMCKNIASFHLIDKAVFHMTLKALVLTTHTVSMKWRVSISLSVWQNGTQYTIKRHCFFSSLCQAHEKKFCLLIYFTLLKDMQVWTKGSVTVGST